MPTLHTKIYDRRCSLCVTIVRVRSFVASSLGKKSVLCNINVMKIVCIAQLHNMRILLWASQIEKKTRTVLFFTVHTSVMARESGLSCDIWYRFGASQSWRGEYLLISLFLEVHKFRLITCQWTIEIFSMAAVIRIVVSNACAHRSSLGALQLLFGICLCVFICYCIGHTSIVWRVCVCLCDFRLFIRFDSLLLFRLEYNYRPAVQNVDFKGKLKRKI